MGGWVSCGGDWWWVGALCVGDPVWGSCGGDCRWLTEGVGVLCVGDPVWGDHVG